MKVGCRFVVDKTAEGREPHRLVIHPHHVITATVSQSSDQVASFVMDEVNICTSFRNLQRRLRVMLRAVSRILVQHFVASGCGRSPCGNKYGYPTMEEVDLL